MHGQAPGTVAPINGTSARAVVNNVLSYVATEVHPSISSIFFNPNATEDVKAYTNANAAKKLAFLESFIIADKTYLAGDTFTIADGYLYIVLSWTPYVGIDLTPYPKVKAYFERIGALENVKAAHARIATNPVTSI